MRSSLLSLLALAAAPLALAAPSPAAAAVSTLQQRDVFADVGVYVGVDLDVNVLGLVHLDLEICVDIQLDLRIWGDHHPSGTCGDGNAIKNCFSQSKSCDDGCQCIDPPPRACTDFCSVFKCSAQGLSTNPDGSCAHCGPHDQWACWRQGGYLDDNCHCVAPTHARNKRDRTISNPVCPMGLTACSVSRSTAGFECLDTTASIDSCGGCVSHGQGTDCSAIEGVNDVQCNKGTCQVISCSSGFDVSEDGTTCDAIVGDADNSNQQILLGSLRGVEKFWAY